MVIRAWINNYVSIILGTIDMLKNLIIMLEQLGGSVSDLWQIIFE